MSESRRIRRRPAGVGSCASVLIAISLSASACGSAPPPVRSPDTAEAQRAPMQIGDAPLIYYEDEVNGPHRYVGGTAYVLVDARPDETLALLDRTEALWQVLPRVLDLKELGFEGRDKLVELEQGTSIVSGRYTVRLRTERYPGGKSSIRFWLDPSRPHALDDAYGSFDMEPYGDGKTLVTWKIRIDLGAGIARWLFEERIRRAAMTTPVRARGYVEERVKKAHRPTGANSNESKNLGRIDAWVFDGSMPISR